MGFSLSHGSTTHSPCSALPCHWWYGDGVLWLSRIHRPNDRWAYCAWLRLHCRSFINNTYYDWTSFPPHHILCNFLAKQILHYLRFELYRSMVRSTPPCRPASRNREQWTEPRGLVKVRTLARFWVAHPSAQYPSIFCHLALHPYALLVESSAGGVVIVFSVFVVVVVVVAIARSSHWSGIVIM